MIIAGLRLNSVLAAGIRVDTRVCACACRRLASAVCPYGRDPLCPLPAPSLLPFCVLFGLVLTGAPLPLADAEVGTTVVFVPRVLTPALASAGCRASVSLPTPSAACNSTIAGAGAAP